MDREQRTAAVKGFVGHLVRLSKMLESRNKRHVAEARAALAQLRRINGAAGLLPVEALPHVMPYLPDELKPAEQARTVADFLLLGGLFAEHPKPAEGASSKRTFGAVMRAVGDHDSAVKRFKKLLNCERANLDAHLRQAIRLAAGSQRQEPVNYFQLLDDILDWDHPDRFVQLKWARDYWRQTNDDKAAEAAALPVQEG